MKKVPSIDRQTPFSKTEIKEALEELSPEWTVKKDHLERHFAFKNFTEALAFTTEIGHIAEEEQHHPEILLKWGEVIVTLWTHSLSGLSKKDFSLAHHIEAEYSTHTRLKKIS